MLEIQLILIYVTCAAIILINGLVIVKSVRNIIPKKTAVLMIPVSETSNDVEFIVRSCVYPFAERTTEPMVILLDFGTSSENIRIFEKLMEHSCNYTIINYEKSSENICNIIESMLY